MRGEFLPDGREQSQLCWCGAKVSLLAVLGGFRVCLGWIFSLMSEDRIAGEHRSGDGAVSFQPRQFTSLCPGSALLSRWFWNGTFSSQLRGIFPQDTAVLPPFWQGQKSLQIQHVGSVHWARGLRCPKLSGREEPRQIPWPGAAPSHIKHSQME